MSPRMAATKTPPLRPKLVLATDKFGVARGLKALAKSGRPFLVSTASLRVTACVMADYWNLGEFEELEKLEVVTRVQPDGTYLIGAI